MNDHIRGNGIINKNRNARTYTSASYPICNLIYQILIFVNKLCYCKDVSAEDITRDIKLFRKIVLYREYNDIYQNNLKNTHFLMEIS